MSSAIGNYYTSKNGSTNKYQYIIDQNDLIKAFNDSRNKLNYALLKESARQRFLIANSEGLKKKFFDAIIEDIKKSTDQLEQQVANDIAGYVIAAVNGGSYSAKGSAFGNFLGRSIGNAIIDLANQIWKEEDKFNY